MWTGSAFKRGARGPGVPAGTNRILLQPLPYLLRNVIGRGYTQSLAVEAKDVRAAGPAQPRRTFDYSFEHGLEIERGAANDLEHASGGRLLLQRLGKVGSALAQLLE